MLAICHFNWSILCLGIDVGMGSKMQCFVLGFVRGASKSVMLTLENSFGRAAQDVAGMDTEYGSLF